MTVTESETGKVATHLIPQAPYAKLRFPNVDIVEEDHRSGTELVAPTGEVVSNCFVGMEPIYVQEVDAALVKISCGIIERGTDESRESAIARLVITSEVLENLLTIEAGMLITLPGIDCIAGGVERQLGNCLSECAIGITLMGTEFYKHPRPRSLYDPECEGYVPVPAGDVGQAVRNLEGEGTNDTFRKSI
jgi:hypothetical protein